MSRDTSNYHDELNVVKSKQQISCTLTRCFWFTGRYTVIPLIVHSQQTGVSHSDKSRGFRVVENTPKVNVLFFKLEIREEYFTQQVDVILRIGLFMIKPNCEFEKSSPTQVTEYRLSAHSQKRGVCLLCMPSRYLQYEGAPCR